MTNIEKKYTYVDPENRNMKIDVARRRENNLGT